MAKNYDFGYFSVGILFIAVNGLILKKILPSGHTGHIPLKFENPKNAQTHTPILLSISFSYTLSYFLSHPQTLMPWSSLVEGDDGSYLHNM